jgi:hypothetical protein
MRKPSGQTARGFLHFILFATADGIVITALPLVDLNIKQLMFVFRAN